MAHEEDHRASGWALVALVEMNNDFQIVLVPKQLVGQKPSHQLDEGIISQPQAQGAGSM